MKLIFLGPPGAGKGTQAEQVSKMYNIAHISTGDMLRAELREQTPLGMTAKAYMDRGDLVPDDVILGMVELRVKKPDCENGFLFDGFPRTLAQAEALLQVTDVDAVININVPFERLVARITGRRMCPDCGAAYHIAVYGDTKCGRCGGVLYQRDDDKAETVENRLRVYLNNTEPLIEFYEQRGLLHTVDGDMPVGEVTSSISEALN